MNTPWFIDIEASALDGYPVQIAYGCSVDQIKSFIIEPFPEWVEDADRWSEDAFECHGFTPAYLRKHGQPASHVAAQVSSDLCNKTVYTDAPGYDEHWLGLLFSAVTRDTGETFSMPTFKSINFDLLPGRTWQWMARREGWQDRMEKLGKRVHHADVDVLVHLLCWQSFDSCEPKSVLP